MPETLPQISIIVPLKNEERSVAQLVAETRPVMDGLGKPYEIVLVDDGSTDGTWDLAQALAREDPRIIGVRFRANCGQTAALSAGFDYSRGEIIVPMDGDLQNDPKDIPRLLEKLDEGYDVVSGWRHLRRDPLFSRRLPSRIANKVVSFVGRTKLHDYGCTLKAYRRDAVEGVRLYGEMHRFIPVFASWQGARITEMKVHHRRRQYGRSNYGIARAIKVILDLFVVKFLADYLHKPIYLFGGIGIVSTLCGCATFVSALYLKLAGLKTLVETPLPLATVLFFVLGMNFFLVGLLAEISVRTYYESQSKTTYRVKETLNPPAPAPRDKRASNRGE